MTCLKAANTLRLNNIMIEDEDLEMYKIATIQMGADRSGCIFGCSFGLHLAITLFFTDFIVLTGRNSTARANHGGQL